MLTAGCPDGTNQTEEIRTWSHDVSSPWTRNGNQEWDATGISLRKFPSLRVVLLGLEVRPCRPAALHSPPTLSRQGVSPELQACSWVYLYMKVRSVRGISLWMHGEGHNILPFYVKSKQRRQPEARKEKPEATNLEWAKRNSHCLP